MWSRGKENGLTAVVGLNLAEGNSIKDFDSKLLEPKLISRELPYHDFIVVKPIWLTNDLHGGYNPPVLPGPFYFRCYFMHIYSGLTLNCVWVIWDGHLNVADEKQHHTYCFHEIAIFKKNKIKFISNTFEEQHSRFSKSNLIITLNWMSWTLF